MQKLSTGNQFLNNGSRIGEDGCGLSQVNIQNNNFNNYMLKNFYLQDCGMSKPIELATSQPNIFYNGSRGVGLGGCNVDESSKLLIGTVQTNPKCRVSLIERPYLTVPYLGRGPGNSTLESELQQGNFFTNRKSINGTTEKSHIPFKNYPLIDSIEENITNPQRLVESAADPNWVRGGIPSREITRSTTNCNK